MFGFAQLVQVLHTHELPQVKRNNGTEVSLAKSVTSCTICDYCNAHTGDHNYQQFQVAVSTQHFSYFAEAHFDIVKNEVHTASNRGPPSLS